LRQKLIFLRQAVVSLCRHAKRI